MAQVISVNVYGVNKEGGPVFKPGFPVSGSAFLPVSEVTTFNGVRVYGKIVTSAIAGRPNEYYVIETVAQLVTLANA
jgi:hypothetical protein